MYTRMEARDCITLYEQAKSLRSPYEPDWRLASAHVLPRHYAAWGGDTSGNGGSAGMRQARSISYDNTGQRSLPKYAAILNRLATPDGKRWHKLTTDPYLMKIHRVRQYFDSLTDLLFKMRYNPKARFKQASGEVYTSIGAYGMGPVSLTWRESTPLDRGGGFAYKAWPLVDIFILTDDFGNVTHVFRRFYLNARQYKLKFGDEDVPRSVRAELDKTGSKDETRRFEFVHMLCVRGDEYDERAINHLRHPVASHYICVEDREYVGEEKGFGYMPILTPRTFTEAGDLYGYSPAIVSLSSMGGVSAMKKTMLKAGQKAVDPVLLRHDDGAISGRIDLRPGFVNNGGVNAAGQKLIQALEVGNFQIGEKLIQDERSDIEDSFFVSLFTYLEERGDVTATQVMEEIAQRASLVEPTMGRLQSEYLGPDIESEITLLAEHGKLPEMPPELVEAKGEYTVTYTSPAAKGQFAEEVTGYMRLKEILVNEAQATQDPSKLDWLNDDEAIPEIADAMAVRTAWVRDKDSVIAIRANRSKQQETQQVVEQAPAIASVVNGALKDKGTSNAKGVSN